MAISVVFLPLALVLLAALAPSRSLAETPLADAVPGWGAVSERLVYDISWGPFDAGQAVLEIRPDPRVGAEGGYQVELTAHTSGLFKRIYPLDLWIRSTLSANLRRSLAFHKIQNDRDMRIRFDWERGTAQLVREDEITEPIDLPASALDPLGLVVALRNQVMAVGSRMTTFFTDGRRAVEGSAGVLREESVETRAGTFSTVVVEPVLHNVGGVFARSENPRMTVWISQDARRLPVRISSRIVLGRVVGELVEVETLQ